MRNKTIALVSVLAMSIVAATGCAPFAPEKTSSPSQSSQGPAQGDQVADVMATTVYVADHNGLVVPLNIKMAQTNAVAKATLEHMVQGSAGDAAVATTGLHNVLPSGTQVRGVSINGGVATVDFSQEVLNYNTLQEEQDIVDAVVWTMTGLDGVDRVKFRIEGHDRPTMKMGTPIADAISRASGINLDVAADVNPSNSTKLTLYFTGSNPEGNFTYLVPVTRILPKTDANIVDLTMQQLAVGPNQDGLGPVFASNLKPEKAEVIDNVATLDFGDDFAVNSNTPTVRNMLNSIVLSVTANAGVDAVQFKVNGEAPVSAEGLGDLSKPVLVPDIINAKEL
ncbi:MAG TPA: GerMN domain-containing protein [Bacilli bacterium]|nr:GerMN domain-containing protein [Bacilli bacterium]